MPDRLGPDERHLRRRQPGVEHRRERRRDRHLHVHEPQARAASWSSRTRCPNDPQDFAFTAGGGLSPASFQLDDDSDGDAVEHAHVRRRAARAAATRSSETVPSGWDQTSATCDDGSPVVEHRRVGGRDRHLHVHEPQARPDRRRQGRAARRPAGLLLHGRRRPHPDQLRARRRRRRHALEHAHLRRRRRRARLLAVRDGAGRLGPDQRHLRRRQPGVEHRRRRRARPSPARSRTASAAASWSSRTPCPTTPRTSRSRPAAASRRRASRSTTTSTRRSRTRGRSTTCRSGPATRSPRPCPPAGTSRAPPATTAARCRTSTVGRRDGHLHVHEPQARPDRGREGRARPTTRRTSRFTAGGGLSPTSFQLDDDANGTLSNTRTFADVPAGERLLARARRCRAAGTRRRPPATTAARCRTSTSRPARPSPARSPTASAADRGRQGRAAQRPAGLLLHGRRRALAGRASSSTTTPTATLSNTRTFANVAPGSGYSVSETRARAAGTRPRATCDDGSPVSNIDVARRRDRHLHVHEQQARPDRGREGRQSRTTRRTSRSRPAAACRPRASSSTTTPTATLSNTHTFTNVPPGSGYSLSETVPSGWDQARATCDDGSPPSNIAVSVGETVTCTFTNRKRGRIVVVKDAQPERPAGLLVHGRRRALPGELPARRRRRPDAVEHAHVHRRAARQRLLARRDRAQRLGPDRGDLRRRQPGLEHRRGARRDGHLHVHEPQARADRRHEGRDPGRPAGLLVHRRRRALARRASRSTTTSTRRSRTRTRSTTCPSAPATPSPRPCPAGWDQSSATCDDGSPVSNISVSAGETSRARSRTTSAGTIVVVKDAVPNDPQDFSFTAGGGLSPASFSLDDDSDGTLSNTRTFANVAAGQRLLAVARPCRAAGTRPAPRATTAARCRTSTSRPGEIVTCTFTNRKRGRIVAVKDATPERPAGLLVHGRRRPLARELQPRRRLRRHAVEHAHVQRRRARQRATRSRRPCPRGWDQTGATCDDGSPVSNIDVAAGRDGHLHVREPQARQARGGRGRGARTTPRTSRSRPAAGSRRRASSSTTTPTATLSNTRTFADLVPGSGYSVSQAHARRLGPRLAPPVTTAAPSRTSTSPPARPSPARSCTTGTAA